MGEAGEDDQALATSLLLRRKSELFSFPKRSRARLMDTAPINISRGSVQHFQFAFLQQAAEFRVGHCQLFGIEPSATRAYGNDELGACRIAPHPVAEFVNSYGGRGTRAEGVPAKVVGPVVDREVLHLFDRASPLEVVAVVNAQLTQALDRMAIQHPIRAI